MYKFEHENLKFSTDGGLDELIALDRYAVSNNDSDTYGVGDTVIFIWDELKGSRKVGAVTAREGDQLTIKARDGEVYTVRSEIATKPMELQPQEFWARWAYGAALVEQDNAHWESQFRWLFDGYRYSPGGRVQLGLGHEYMGLPKAPLTLTNCFVLPVPKGSDNPVEQWNHVIDELLIEMQISRRGGGVGINISQIQTVPGVKKVDIALYLPESHPDAQELGQRRKLGKFDGVSFRGHQAKDALVTVDDSIEGHIQALRDMVNAAYKGKSVYVSFSQIRPRNAVVKGVNGRSSGASAWMELFALVARMLAQPQVDAVEFAEIFSFVINLIQQGGSRRGALMLVCNDNSPVLEKFITRKRTAGFLSGANISVGISDSFMEKVKAHKQYLKSAGEHSDAEAERAHQLWMLIIESAWASAEPGVIFIERYNKLSNSYYYAQIVATNPCGEQGLPENGACNLGHLVLPRYIQGDWTQGAATMDWNALQKAVRLGVRFQDNMVTYGDFPTPETKAQQMQERRVGMGTMGLGTLLIMLGLRYGSPNAEKFLDQLYSQIAYWAYDESMNMAAEKGSFPAYRYEEHIKSGFIEKLFARFPDLAEKLKSHGIRNVTLVTQAPTGSTGTYIDQMPGMNCSTGIEPYFAFTFWRAGRLGVHEQDVDLVKEWKAANPGKELPPYFVTAMDLSPEEHVRVQAAVQQWVDSSISKTANAPNSFTVEETDDLYMLSYDLGLKGMTIYRDGSRQAQVLSTKKEDAKLEAHIEADLLQALMAEEPWGKAPAAQEKADAPLIRKRPSRLFGFTEKVRIPMGERLSKAYITINVDEGGLPVEVFIVANDADLKPTAEALGRMVTQFLRFGSTQDNAEQAVKHLKQGQTYGTLPWWVANLLEGTVYGKIKFPGALKPAKAGYLQTCPDCGEKAFDKVNCICTACGSSKCN